MYIFYIYSIIYFFVCYSPLSKEIQNYSPLSKEIQEKTIFQKRIDLTTNSLSDLVNIEIYRLVILDLHKLCFNIHC